MQIPGKGNCFKIKWPHNHTNAVCKASSFFSTNKNLIFKALVLFPFHGKVHFAIANMSGHIDFLPFHMRSAPSDIQRNSTNLPTAWHCILWHPTILYAYPGKIF